jgi:hypothetical protein
MLLDYSDLSRMLYIDLEFDLASRLITKQPPLLTEKCETLHHLLQWGFF